MIDFKKIVLDLKNNKELVEKLYLIFDIKVNGKEISIDIGDERVALSFKEDLCTSIFIISEYGLEFIQDWECFCESYVDNISISFNAQTNKMRVEGECIKDERAPAAYCGLNVFEFVNLLNEYRIEK